MTSKTATTRPPISVNFTPPYVKIGAMETTKEQWVSVPGFSRYEVSDRGRVRAVPYVDKRGNRRGMRYLRPAPIRGYRRLELVPDDGDPRGVFVHTLVLLGFVGEPEEDQQCRHLDGDPGNNHVGNLAWGTAQENADDRVRHGTLRQGERNHSTKLSATDIGKVRRRRRSGETYRSIAEDFDVSLQAIYYACRGRTWKNVDAATAPKVYRKKGIKSA